MAKQIQLQKSYDFASIWSSNYYNNVYEINVMLHSVTGNFIKTQSFSRFFFLLLKKQNQNLSIQVYTFCLGLSWAVEQGPCKQSVSHAESRSILHFAQ